MRKFPSLKELVILRLLAKVPRGMYGLELVKASGGEISVNSVYVLLGRLVKKQFVAAKVVEKGHAGMPRPVYRLSEHGKRALRAADELGV